MQLRITDTNDLLELDFGLWLIPLVRAKLISGMRRHDWRALDEYLSTSDKMKRLYNRKYTAQEIITFASNNLICTKSSGNLVLSFRNTKFVPGFDRLKLGTAIRLINYGNMSVKGKPVFTDTFYHFSKNIHTYIKDYYMI